MADKAVRQIRAWVWYVLVKQKSKVRKKMMTDYDLDGMFGTDDKGNPYKGADRLKMFEAIRSFGSIPKAIVYHDITISKSFTLIEAVDRKEQFKGTAAVINSPFWRLIDQRPLKLIELRALIVDCVKRLGLDQVQQLETGFEPTPITLRQWAETYPDMTIREYLELTDEVYDVNYDHLLTRALVWLTPSLDFAALLGGMALEAYHAGNTSIAFNLESSFMTIIESFCELQHIRFFTQTSPHLRKGKKRLQLNVMLKQLAGVRMRNALSADKRKGLPDYKDLFEPSANRQAPIMVLLKKHEQILWNK